jgi:Ca2+-binding EF-hand superfamily protein
MAVTVLILGTAHAAPPPGTGLSGAGVSPVGSDTNAGAQRMRERCQENPQQCEQIKEKLKEKRAECQSDPEKCREEMRKKIAARFKKADTDGNGMISRSEAEQGMPMVARKFEQLDTNKDGQISPEELQAAHSQRKGSAQ